MYYKEFLRTRTALLVFAIIAAGVWLILGVLSLVLPGSMTGDTHKVAIEQTPWPALLGAAGFAAAILATVLGSVLSQENEGHLELAFTKPYSRVLYASTAIAVDVAAILLAELIGFAAILLHYAVFHCPSCPGQQEQLVGGPDPFAAALSCVLFPLAWYAGIVALTASLRRSANIVRATIWPVAITLVALQQVAPAGAWQAWHNFFVGLNVLNPLYYVWLQNTTNGSDMPTVPLQVAVVVLALFAIAGWGAAMLQWRRVEA